MDPIIIFGPTGHVGSAVALAAPSLDASTTILAMRTPSKPIPCLTPALEASHPYIRIQADLSSPSTLTTAVSSTGATRAFVYIDHTSPDFMLSAFTALKEGGIKFVVFLSTGIIRGDLSAVTTNDIITYSHARVEMNLQRVFGRENVVPIRPAFFASNAFWWKGAVPSGKVKVYAPELRVDWIAPEDIGRVAASVLVNGTKEGYEEAVWLVGPQKVSLREGLGMIVRAVTGKEGEVVEVGAEEGKSMYVEFGLPPPMAETLVESFGKLKVLQEAGGGLVTDEEWEAGAKAVETYTGRPAMKLEEWIEENKDEFRA
ncbi:hypothetical protein QBC34DRAFT_374654 [Podospora aff. communis PSN243]|uniref:NmrA-like domain-containing protein n=1 Tax=Podospora aff. communis PSN243 TaxID=3040156 RepID=A0AAV9H1H6_9PEZI|nr:hypothetical protein QBC34DRAFT_374654 [Podospora aff. communis PSN243]